MLGVWNSGLPSGPATVAETLCVTVSPLWNVRRSPWSIVISVVENRLGGAASTVLSAQPMAGQSSAAAPAATTVRRIVEPVIPTTSRRRLYTNVHDLGYTCRRPHGRGSDAGPTAAVRRRGGHDLDVCCACARAGWWQQRPLAGLRGPERKARALRPEARGHEGEVAPVVRPLHGAA